MKNLLFISLLAFTTTANAANKAVCDAKPFTLKKPVVQAPPPPPKPVAAPAKTMPVAKPKIVIGCKQSAAK